MGRRTFTAVSLFSGAGGLDVGLERAGFRLVTATDVDKDSLETLRATQAARLPMIGDLDRVHLDGTRLLESDVRTLSAADLRPAGVRRDWRPDVLTGGPPCQPWSSAGHQRGLDDPRGQLIAHLIRLTDELRPRFVLFENVRGLVTAVGPNGRAGEVLRSVQEAFDAIGYASTVATLNAADYGAAQRRVRLVLIASGDHKLPAWPLQTHSRNPDPETGSKPWVSLRSLLATLPAALPEDLVRPSGPRAVELERLSPGTGLRTGGRVESNRPGGHWGYRQDSFLADQELPARTVRAATTPDWIRDENGELRRLTWRECAALQGFPTGWQFSGTVAARFRQIGNAVQAELGAALGETLIGALAKGRARSAPVTPPWPPELEKRVRYTLAEHKINHHHRVRVRPAIDQ